MQTIILTGGGTAGHITPNLALLPYLDKFQVHYCGEAGSMEERMLSAYPQVRFHPLPCIKFRRSLSPANAKIPFVLARGVRQAKALIDELRPRVVFSKGGYVALPVCLAAAKRNIPLIIHESDATMGLSNRLVARKSRYVCTASAALADKLDNGLYTGLPLRRELYEGNRERIYALGLPRVGKPNLLVFGGSQGALAVNHAVEDALDDLLARFRIVHIAGAHPFSQTRIGYKRLEFTDRMADCYAWADFVLCRAGAGTLSELTALRKPALVVPLPKSRSSRGDQEQNAEILRAQGAIRVLPQSELTPETLVAALDDLVKNRDALVRHMSALPDADGTRKIADLLCSYL